MKRVMKPGYAQVNGIKMYYEVYGEGYLPLVLIHGGGSTIESSFGHILPYLKDYGKIIAVELQAHGRTDDRDVQESFTQDAADVAALLKHLKIEKANFLGFSNGGTTTLQIAVTYPQLVNKIITISATYLRAGMAPGFFDGMQGATLKDMPQPLQDAFLKVNPDKIKLQRMFDQDKGRMIGFTDMNETELRSIKVPALIMGSDKDVVLPAHTINISQVVPNAKLVILPGFHGEFLGDVSSYKEGSNMPQVAAIIIKEFLKK